MAAVNPCHLFSVASTSYLLAYIDDASILIIQWYLSVMLIMSTDKSIM
uniref:Uncharacterized protein n=1 Tax=Arundo donax TaxID=35708 RepID=A0A0A9B955_ARUDO